jgi:hypothetical protein
VTEYLKLTGGKYVDIRDVEDIYAQNLTLSVDVPKNVEKVHISVMRSVYYEYGFY